MNTAVLPPHFLFSYMLRLPSSRVAWATLIVEGTAKTPSRGEGNTDSGIFWKMALSEPSEREGGREGKK